MAKIKGVCKNYDECDLAEAKEVQEAEKTNFVCSECGKPLYAVSGGNVGPDDGGKKKKIIMVGVAALVAVGLGFGGYWWYTSKEKPVKQDPPQIDTPKPEPEPGGETPTDTIAVQEDDGISTGQPDAPDKPDGNAVVTKDLGYAVWVGRVKNGKMHDTQGTLTFKSSHIIDSRDDKQRKAGAGDKVIGTFENGHLTQGRWYKANGDSESIILGSSGADD